jgi:hypothetical protein
MLQNLLVSNTPGTDQKVHAAGELKIGRDFTEYATVFENTVAHTSQVQWTQESSLN